MSTNKTEKPDGLIFVDIETGGLNPSVHAITEMAFAVTDLNGNNISKKMDAKVLTSGVICDAAMKMKINGYNEETWKKEAINFKVFMRIFVFCFSEDKKLQWVGSNPKFDYDFIAAHCARDNIKFEPALYSHHLLDVGSMCWPLLHSGKVSSIRQNNLAAYYALGEQSHSAAGDVDQCIKIYQTFVKPNITVHR